MDNARLGQSEIAIGYAFAYVCLPHHRTCGPSIRRLRELIRFPMTKRECLRESK